MLCCERVCTIYSRVLKRKTHKYSLKEKNMCPAGSAVRIYTNTKCNVRFRYDNVIKTKKKKQILS